MIIYLAADHAGFELKEKVKEYLLENGFQIEDCGAYDFNENDDYPDFIYNAALKVGGEDNTFGIIFGKSGAGEAIVANKINNVRAVLGFCEENVRLSREHNNANVLSIGTQFTDFENTKKFIDIFLNTTFSGEIRHLRRINKILDIEQKKYA